MPGPEPITPQTDTSFAQVFEGLLKSPKSLIEGITKSETPGAFISKLLLLALGGFLIFGITLGSFSFHEQLWAAPLKTVLGLAFSTVICLPSLYVFSALTGTTLGVKEIIQGMAGALALMASLLLGFTLRHAHEFFVEASIAHISFLRMQVLKEAFADDRIRVAGNTNLLQHGIDVRSHFGLASFSEDDEHAASLLNVHRDVLEFLSCEGQARATKQQEVALLEFLQAELLLVDFTLQVKLKC